MASSAPQQGYPNTGNPATTIADKLVRRDQWVCWRYEWNAKEERRQKIPINPRTGHKAKTNDPSTWATFRQALAAHREHGHDGVGFVLTPGDPFVFIDLDGVRDPETDEIEPWAMEIVRALGSYAEVSPSGTGLRIAVLGKMAFKKAGAKPVELFSCGGYVTITGDALAGFDGPIVEAQEQLEDLYRERCQPAPSQAVEVAASEPLPDPIDLTDGELLDKARTADKLGWKFEALFDRGDTSVSKNDASAADNDLMMQLAFWTGKDPDRMERLFSESALGRRDKWRTRPDYRRRTVSNATKKTGAIYEPELHRPEKTRTRDRLKKMVAHAVLGHPWKEKAGRADAGATDFFGYLGLLRLAHRANTLEIDVGVRGYMEAAGISDFTTALNSLSRLEDTHGLVVKVRDGGGGNAARYRLRTGSKPKHIEIRGETPNPNPPCVYNACAGLLIPLAGAHLIRNASPEMPEYDRHGRKIPKGAAPLVKSVGKTAAMVAYVVASCAPVFEGGTVPPEFVSDRTGVTVKNLKARHIPKLVAAGLVEEAEAGYAPPADVTTALKEELRVSGSLAYADHQRQRHDRQRRVREMKRLAWLGHDAEAVAAETGYAISEVEAVLAPTGQAPTEADMHAARLAKSADGSYSDLEREAEHFPKVYTADADPQHPIGHDYPEIPQEALQEPVTAPEDFPKGAALTATHEAAQRPTETQDETPCKHSGLGHVFPGGRGCYCCDKTHPYREATA